MNNLAALSGTVAALLANEKGLLAMDESTPTCNARFAKLGIPQTIEARRAWRELIVTTPGLAESIGGAILFDETMHQQTRDGQPFLRVLQDAGIIVGIKVDAGAKDLAGHAGEKVTEGLDGLRERLQEYARMGARFAKWRGVIAIGPLLPSRACIDANAHALARYAALCQEAGLVPIVEPEVLMEGDHSLARCATVSEEVLRRVFRHLHKQGVAPEGMLLKPAMVLPGSACTEPASDDRIADATIGCFLRVVPAAVAGVTFLSGGQTGPVAASRLNAMHRKFGSRMPWPLSFSFSRAIQQSALEIWRGDPANVQNAQHELAKRAADSRAAVGGRYQTQQRPV
ncbi:MAG: class I fructose-bisphosphate aldolase [Burkholderiaceae bacterium]